MSDFISLPSKAVDCIIHMGGEIICNLIKGLQKYSHLMINFFGIKPGKLIIRKLTYFSDKEGKTRVIGILDYFSQAILKPLHTYLFRVLKKIPQDCTFDQSSFKTKIES